MFEEEVAPATFIIIGIIAGIIVLAMACSLGLVGALLWLG